MYKNIQHDGGEIVWFLFVDGSSIFVLVLEGDILRNSNIDISDHLFIHLSLEVSLIAAEHKEAEHSQEHQGRHNDWSVSWSSINHEVIERSVHSSHADFRHLIEGLADSIENSLHWDNVSSILEAIYGSTWDNEDSFSGHDILLVIQQRVLLASLGIIDIEGILHTSLNIIRINTDVSQDSLRAGFHISSVNASVFIGKEIMPPDFTSIGSDQAELSQVFHDNISTGIWKVTIWISSAVLATADTVFKVGVVWITSGSGEVREMDLHSGGFVEDVLIFLPCSHESETLDVTTGEPEVVVNILVLGDHEVVDDLDVLDSFVLGLQELNELFSSLLGKKN